MKLFVNMFHHQVLTWHSYSLTNIQDIELIRMGYTNKVDFI